MNVKIIADSTCDLTTEIINKFDIDIIPLYVILDEVSYKDAIDITPYKLIDWSNETKHIPKTSAPTIDDYMAAFKPYADKRQDIVFISVSSELSATCQNAHIAAEMIDNITIKVVDGRNVTTGTGCIVYMASKFAKEGKTADEIVKKLQTIIPKVSANFIFDSLEFLKRGGRCSAVKAFSATALKIRPEINVVDGLLIPGDKYRGSLAKVLSKYCEKRLENLEEIDPEIIFVAKTKDEEGLNDILYEQVKSKNYFKNIIRTDAGCVITSHSGPGAHALIYIKK